MQAALTAVFAVAACVFWYRGYVCALSYHEELQMFLFDCGYLAEKLSTPGGGAACAAEFLVQFFFFPPVGSVIIALLLAAVQLMTWNAMRRMGVKPLLYPLSFVPALLLWQYMGDANVMLALPVALLCAQCASWGYSKLRSEAAKWLFSAVAFPLLYWLIGPAVAVCAVFDTITDIRRDGNTGRSWLRMGLRAVLTLGCMLASQYVVHYPLARIMAGIHYFRFPTDVPLMQFAVMAAVAFWPLLCAIRLPLHPFNGKGGAVAAGVETAVVALLGIVLVPTGFNATTYELLDYDYLVRIGLWDKIIAKADKKQPSAPMSVACLNLALAETGQLADRMFSYYQNGREGLLPTFSRDFISPLPTAEAYLSLGMINTAQRFIFEAQEAIPNYNKSARMTKRLAETNLLNGQYAVAAKYLRMLKKTLFYRSWAEKTEKLLWNEKAVSADPWYSRLRSLRYTNDFLYSDRETDQMLGILFVRNHDNRMAFEYLMAYELLQKDLEQFSKYYPIGRFAGYSRIPTSYQEALVFIWMQSHNSFRGMPWSIERQTVEAMSDFGKRYSANPNDPMLTSGYLGSTYWSYLFKSSNQKQ